MRTRICGEYNEKCVAQDLMKERDRCKDALMVAYYDDDFGYPINLGTIFEQIWKGEENTPPPDSL